MNCKELLSYLQEDPAADRSSRLEDAEISSHLTVCAGCARLVKQQRELADSLRLLRGSECKAPTILDAVVLANYRRQVPKLEKPTALSAWRLRPVAVFAWSAAAAALILAAVLFFSPRQEVTRTTTPPAEFEAASRTDPIAEKPAQATGKNVMAHPKSVAARNKHNSGFGRVSARPSEPQLPQEAFRSLMYCDELSCSDAMEMIRVELPASYVTRPMLASMPANGVVTADILVGPDGIARGIRIEE